MNDFTTWPTMPACRIAIALFLALTMQAAGAQRTDSSHGSGQPAAAVVSDLVAHYPKGGINTDEMADHALADVERARAAVRSQYAADERACYPKFFSNTCIDEAKERQRVALAKISPIEIEAKMFQRHARVIERDKALAEKQAKEEAEAADRLKAQEENEKQAAEKAVQRDQKAQANAAKEKNDAAIVSTRQQEHDAKMKKVQEEEQRKAPEREKNIAAYQKKVKEAEEHHRQLQERKLKKEAEKKSEPAAPKQ